MSNSVIHVVDSKLDLFFHEKMFNHSFILHLIYRCLKKQQASPTFQYYFNYENVHLQHAWNYLIATIKW